MIAEPSPSRSPERLCSDFEIVAPLSEGPSPRLFCCRQPIPGRSEQLFAVAVFKEADSVRRRELATRLGPITAVRHPNLVKVHEIIDEDDRLFVVQELVRGRSLHAVLESLVRHGLPLSEGMAVWITTRLLAGLAAAHDATGPRGERLRLVHGRLSPSAVMISQNGRVKVGGVGLASADPHWRNVPWEHHPSVGYLAPEILDKDTGDLRADLFGIGAILFHLLTGRGPFAAESATATLRANRRARVRVERASALLDVALRAMSPAPEERYADVATMLEALAPHLEEEIPMALGVASLMRTAMGELAGRQLGPRPKHPTAVTATAPLVCLCSADENKQRMLRDVAAKRGYWLECHQNPTSLVDSWGIGIPPDVLVVDLDSESLNPRHLRLVVAQTTPPVPLVAWGKSLDGTDVGRANLLGAKDLLDANAGTNRLIFALKRALRTRRRSPSPGQPPTPQRLLFVGLDGPLIGRVLPDLIKAGFAADVANDPSSALEQAGDASHAGVVMDTDGIDELEEFLETFRALPGMGMIPMLLLDDERAHPTLERVASVRRQCPSHELVLALTDLIADTSAGRTFTRFAANLPVELRYGGRTASGEVLNVSRGGLLVGIDVAIPIGTLMSVAMELPGAGALEAAARVVRATDDRLGLEFEHFVDGGEPRLIRYLTDLRDGPRDTGPPV